MCVKTGQLPTILERLISKITSKSVNLCFNRSFNSIQVIMARSDSSPVLTSELAIEILNKTLEELQTTENVKKLDEAKENVGNEMLKMMQFHFPIVLQVQMDVIKDYGFSPGRDGIIKFAQMLRTLERDDTEIARLHELIKAFYLPPVAANTSNESPADDRTSSS